MYALYTTKNIVKKTVFQFSWIATLLQFHLDNFLDLFVYVIDTRKECFS